MRDFRGLALQGWAQTLSLAGCLLVLTSQLVAPVYAQSTDNAQSQVHAQSQESAEQNAITLSGAERSREGYFQLQVEGLSEDQQFVIEQSSTAEFETIEARFPPLGSFRQISLSGFDNGTYYFRARVEDGEGSAVYSNTHQLTVQHYPLWQALSLFGLGALLFVALVTTLFRLHWRSQREQPAKDGKGAHG